MSPRASAVLAVAVVALAGLAWLASPRPAAPEDPSNLRLAATNRVEGAALCPWREPAADLAALFPGATNFRAEVRILSGRRTEMAKRLGRQPGADENALHVFRVPDSGTAGVVLVRRVKGENGAIELVLGVDRDGAVRGLRLQRLREPEPIAAFLRSPAWLDTFRGRRADAPRPDNGGDVAVPDAARVSANAIAEGVHGLLVLFEISNSGTVPVTAVAGPPSGPTPP
jgi:hypothetical protein